MSELVLKLDPTCELRVQKSVSTTRSFIIRVITTRSVPFYINFGLYMMKRSMPTVSHVGAIAIDPDNEPSLLIELSTQRDGLYVLIADPPTDTPPLTAAGPKFDPDRPYAPLWMGADGAKAPDDLAAAIIHAVSAQSDYRERLIAQVGYSGPKRFAVHALLEGCLVDYYQVLEGGSVAPWTKGLGPESVLAAINGILAPHDVSILPWQEMDERFRHAHPLAVASYHNVVAEDGPAAVSTVFSRLNVLCGVLAADRGGNPRPICYIIQQLDEAIWALHVPSESYRGNLIGGIVAGTVTEFVDELSIAIEKDPWLGLALNLLRETINESVALHKLFKAWSLLEAAAKRSVPKSNIYVTDHLGHKIPYRGKHLTLQHDLGRVTAYLRDHVKCGHESVKKDKTWHLTDQVKAAYMLRNIVAHEGAVIKPGVHDADAISFLDGFGVFNVMDWVKAALRYECYLLQPTADEQ